jgi:hypothetical protein
VNPQDDLAARLAEAVERRQGHQDVVADTLDVDDNPIGLLFEKAPAEIRNHERAGL